MSRGKPSLRALDAAVRVAQARGEVIFLRQYPGSTCDFFIDGAGGLTAVSLKRSLRIRACLDEISRQYHETLIYISSAEHAAGIAREFWLWSKYGTMRFFRIEGLVLTELNRFGVPLNPPVSCILAASLKTGAVLPGKKYGEPGSGKNIFPVNVPVPEPGKSFFPEKIPGAGQGSPAVPGPVPGGQREPAPVRYLRRMAVERQKAKVLSTGLIPDKPGGGTPPG